MCSRYDNMAVDFIIPTPIIFNTLCESYDKTNMFIVGGLRIIILKTIYEYVFSQVKLSNSYLQVLKLCIMMYILVNVCILLYIISKQQKYSKFDFADQNVLSDTHNLND